MWICAGVKSPALFCHNFYKNIIHCHHYWVELIIWATTCSDIPDSKENNYDNQNELWESLEAFIITGSKEDYEAVLTAVIAENEDEEPPDYLFEKIIYNLEVMRGKSD